MTYLLIGERYLHVPRAHLAASVVGGMIEISTDVFAREVALRMDGPAGTVFEDNFFDMAPGQRRTVKVIVPAGGNEVAVRAFNADEVRIRLRDE